jgi:hypothetical protein
MSETPQHRGLYSGFESYRIPSTEEIDAALTRGIVAVDTNVLLNLYRYEESTVNDLFRVMGKVGDRLFEPHQVLREFWRNRQTVLGNPATSIRDTNAAFTKNQRSSTDALENWAKNVALDSEELDRLRTMIKTLYDSLRARVDQGASSIVDASTSTDLDDVLTRLDALLNGRVGAPLDQEAWTVAVEEGRRRVLAGEPPGFGDADKLESENPEGASGDYLVWTQLISESKERQTDLVLVTGDVKEDWWEKHRGHPISARRELVEEFTAATEHRVYFLEPLEFLRRAKPALDVEINLTSLLDVERVRDEPVTTVPWDAESIENLLARLETEGKVQADVIREAAANNGVITRERVYQLDGRDDETMLRGFTRPVTRLTSELQGLDLVIDGVSPMLRSVYETGVKTSHFAVPDEVVAYLNQP